MAVTDLHTLDISEPMTTMFSTGKTIPGAVLSLVEQTPQVSVGSNTPIVMTGRAKGSLRHEGQAKVDNGRAPSPRPFTTAKLIYSQRVTDEFLIWDEKKQGDFVSNLVTDWLTKSMPRDIDTIVIHGRDPFSGTADTQLSDYIRKPGSSILVPSTGDTGAAVDTDLGTAVVELEDYNISGIAISSTAASALAKVIEGNTKKYPELGVFGLAGDGLAGKRAASSPEVGQYDDTKIVMGDWSQLLLGFAGQATWKTLTSGNPDNVFDESGKPVDLGGVNMVCIRLETHFGFRVLDGNAFAVVSEAEDPDPEP